MSESDRKGLRSRLSFFGAAILFMAGLYVMAIPALSDTYDSRVHQYPQGYDLWTYYMGSKVFFDHGIDPYDNQALHEYVRSRRLRSNHEDPEYDLRALAVIGGQNRNGYLGSPFTLLLFRLLGVAGFRTLTRVWPILSAILILIPALLLAGRLVFRDDDTLLQKLAVLLWTGNLLLWNRAFWVHTILHGQIDFLYLSPLLFALVLMSPGKTRPLGRFRLPVASFLFAFAACVKVFPAVFILVYGGLGIAEAIRRRREKKSAPAQKIIGLRVALYSLGWMLVLAVGGALAIHRAGGDVFALTEAWRVKLSASLHDPLLIYRQNNPHMAPYLHNYLLYLLRVWCRLWDVLSEETLRTATRILSFVAAVLCLRAAALLRRDALLVPALFVAALPTLLPHWWNYYNTIMLIPFLVLAGVARRASPKDAGRLILLLVFSYLLMTVNYVFIGDILAPFPAAAKAIMGHHLEFLHYNLTPYNLLFGYPGNLLLLLAAFQGLRLERRQSSH